MEKFTYFIDNPNKRLFCPICKNIYTDPVLTECGHTFCRECIIAQKDECPMDSNTCKLKFVNLIIAEQISELQIRCTYGIRLLDSDSHDRSLKNLIIDENGCTENISYGKRSEHESECTYRIVKCPNSDHCPKIKFRDLDDHLKVCKNTKCPNSKYHCPYQGLSTDVEVHVKSCRYEDFKEIVTIYDEKLNAYEEVLNRQLKIISKKDEQLEAVTSTLNQLAVRLDGLERKVEEKLNFVEETQQTILDEMNTEYKKLSDDIKDLKLKYNEPKNKNSELMPDKQQTTVKCLGTFIGHTATVTCLVCYNECLISGSLDDYIKIWDTQSKYICVKSLESNTGGVAKMTLKESFLYSVGVKDIKVTIWDLDTYQRLNEFSCNENIVYSILAVEKKIIIGSNEIIKVYEEPKLQIIKEIKEEGVQVYTLKAYDKFLFTGSFKAIKIWDLTRLTLIHKIALPGSDIHSIIMYPRYVIVANDSSIYLLDSKNYQLVSTFNGHREQIIDLVVAQSNLGDKLFSASKDHTLRVWSLENLICLQTLHRHEGNVTALASIQNRVFSGATDQQIKVWQINAFGGN